MKTLIIFAFALFLGLECSAQSQCKNCGQVGPKHNWAPSVYSVMNFINRGSDTAIWFKSLLVDNLKDLLKDTIQFNSNWLEWAIRDQSSFVVVTLKKGTFYNSEWNPATGKIEPFPSKVDFTGIVLFFKLGTYQTSLDKENCWNPLFERSTNGFHQPVQPSITNQKQPSDTQQQIKQDQNSGSQPNYNYNGEGQGEELYIYDRRGCCGMANPNGFIGFVRVR